MPKSESPTLPSDSQLETSTQVTPPKRKTEIKQVPLAVIWPNPNNPRFYQDPDAVPKLAANMKATGQKPRLN
jgi:hypothetical protein